MVLESIIGEKNIRKHPIFIFFLTILICAGSIFFADLLFPKHASVLSVAFITIGIVPLVFNVLSKEEAEESICRRSSCTFFARHFNLIMLYVWIFVGVIFTFALYYAIVPDNAKVSLFEEQVGSFCRISGACSNGVPISITGKASAFGLDACKSATSDVVSCTLFIFENNAGVLIFTVALSLLYGVGAIFIIVWNASILGVFFGETLLAGDLVKWLSMFQSMLIGHGPPELMGYVFGALAGAILSAMVAKGQLLTHDAQIIIKDVIFLFVLALFSVAYGAVTEAVGMMKLTDLYFVMGFLYLLVIIVAVFLYSNTRSAPKFSLQS
ncbi:MAG: hypothetical protein WCW44_00180 [archaeon]|jgi:uncharacterized membrane protein SpoIIM required for sporulation